jgi:hypothetical protein
MSTELHAIRRLETSIAAQISDMNVHMLKQNYQWAITQAEKYYFTYRDGISEEEISSADIVRNVLFSFIRNESHVLAMSRGVPIKNDSQFSPDFAPAAVEQFDKDKNAVFVQKLSSVIHSLTGIPPHVEQKEDGKYVLSAASSPHNGTSLLASTATPTI